MNTITTQKELRKVFKAEHPQLDFKRITNYSGYGTMYKTDTRCAFINWLDALRCDGVISEKLADRATL